MAHIGDGGEKILGAPTPGQVRNWNRACKRDLALKVTSIVLVFLVTAGALGWGAHKVYHHIPEKFLTAPEFAPLLSGATLGIILLKHRDERHLPWLPIAITVPVIGVYSNPTILGGGIITAAALTPLVAMRDYFDTTAYYRLRAQISKDLLNPNVSFEDLAQAFGNRAHKLGHCSDWDNLVRYGFIDDNQEINGLKVNRWLERSSETVIKAGKRIKEIEADFSEVDEANVEYRQKLKEIDDINETWRKHQASVCYKYEEVAATGRSRLENALFNFNTRIDHSNHEVLHGPAHHEEEDDEDPSHGSRHGRGVIEQNRSTPSENHTIHSTHLHRKMKGTDIPVIEQHHPTVQHDGEVTDHHTPT